MSVPPSGFRALSAAMVYGQGGHFLAHYQLVGSVPLPATAEIAVAVIAKSLAGPSL
ncbi:hypothetical protein [Methylovulum psychrotolerans]|uniref:Uncharacterized protein n=1 Tax=Methylovulum psychrotolerans TaxID=1704499 RepID=A0A2S5CKM1_9GAMM|nr:hypothetical protein [Methylovulum psychrotolerans]POZ51370.1 hypothetical protein AADEFJLK_02819 [Methylovulum psychrotolerans]